MNLTKKQVKHIAKLAKLKLSNGEIEKFREQLSSILEYAGLLEEVDTKNVEPTAQTTGLKNVYREDKSSKEQCLTQKEVLGNVPERKNGFIKTNAALWDFSVTRKNSKSEIRSSKQILNHKS